MLNIRWCLWRGELGLSHGREQRPEDPILVDVDYSQARVTVVFRLGVNSHQVFEQNASVSIGGKGGGLVKVK